MSQQSLELAIPITPVLHQQQPGIATPPVTETTADNAQPSLVTRILTILGVTAAGLSVLYAGHSLFRFFFPVAKSDDDHSNDQKNLGNVTSQISSSTPPTIVNTASKVSSSTPPITPITNDIKVTEAFTNTTGGCGVATLSDTVAIQACTRGSGGYGSLDGTLININGSTAPTASLDPVNFPQNPVHVSASPNRMFGVSTTKECGGLKGLTYTPPSTISTRFTAYGGCLTGTSKFILTLNNGETIRAFTDNFFDINLESYNQTGSHITAAISEYGQFADSSHSRLSLIRDAGGDSKVYLLWATNSSTPNSHDIHFKPIDSSSLSQLKPKITAMEDCLPPAQMTIAPDGQKYLVCGTSEGKIKMSIYGADDSPIARNLIIDTGTFFSTNPRIIIVPTPTGYIELPFWQSSNHTLDGDGWGIIAQPTSNGVAVDQPFLINQNTTGDQTEPDGHVFLDGKNIIFNWQQIRNNVVEYMTRIFQNNQVTTTTTSSSSTSTTSSSTTTATNNSSTTAPSPENTDLATILGISIPLGTIAAAGIPITICLVKKCKKPANTNAVEMSASSSSSSSTTNTHELPTINDGLIFGKEIASGAFGTVTLGTLDGSAVAIKGLKEEMASDSNASNDFANELKTMANLRHPNIVHFYGVHYKDGRNFIVLELMDQTLRHYLNNQTNIPGLIRYGFAQSIAAGIACLHRLGIIHRDLKSQNVLLTRDLTAKIADLGSSIVPAQQKEDTAGVGTDQWMAPEVIIQNSSCNVVIDYCSQSGVEALRQKYSVELQEKSKERAIAQTILNNGQIPPKHPLAIILHTHLIVSDKGEYFLVSYDAKQNLRNEPINKSTNNEVYKELKKSLPFNDQAPSKSTKKTTTILTKLLQHVPYTKAVDIYSYGIMLSEICTQEVPYGDLKRSNPKLLQDELLTMVATRGTRPATENLPANKFATLLNFYHRCVANSPNDRPTIEQIVEQVPKLQGLIESVISSPPPQETNTSKTL